MDKSAKNTNPNKIRKIFETILTVLIVVVSVFAIGISITRIYVNNNFDNFFVNGQSMYPTFNKDTTDADGNKYNVDGGNLHSEVAHHVDYGLYDPREKTINKLKRFDIVICTFGENTDACIKRIVGLPGETIKFSSSGDLSIKNSNGEFTLVEQPIEKQYLVGSYPTSEIVLGEGKYYCLGDNRAHSSDSRVNGAVDKSKIEGKVVALTGYCSVKKNNNDDYDITKVYYKWPRFF